VSYMPAMLIAADRAVARRCLVKSGLLSPGRLGLIAALRAPGERRLLPDICSTWKHAHE
jgi:hypothetical protein